ncbi:unnamed protein product [Protopolystoma xenopodis]|uniref:Uncharacterized protein n=1 Tax=Protopolystoma xenopodis TaxID=117903 RepID=A0A448XGK5_9PLAT|nr:unnamed protein product [Protopolystoma xenopodis]
MLAEIPDARLIYSLEPIILTASYRLSDVILMDCRMHVSSCARNVPTSHTPPLLSSPTVMKPSYPTPA